MNPDQSVVNRERVVRVPNGWTILIPLIAILILDAVSLFLETQNPTLILLRIAVLVACILMLKGFFSLQPNEARVLILFGNYKGSVRTSGFHWANPFYSNGGQGQFRLTRGVAIAQSASSGTEGGSLGRNKISLRARTLNGEKLKVNDKRGNPIEIAAIVVWRIADTAQAFFDVDDYENYVPIQSESALRHIANMYAYDDGDGNETTLRNNVDEVSQALRQELEERLAKAGVVVDEARLAHLAYAPEIAQVMLRRQQAEAVVAARQKIVEGAVSMVDMALKELASKNVVQLDDERRAAMVSNLMVVLCSESEVHPVVNTGTLYT
ncbi:MAG TPA: SPFH domain-containing protein [Acidobacteriaceae bacterium]|jgi:regulator of protease activity HflC (stomatin/prohibitin superfamily)|nr:SPFH domain-containing protein [Acidobacteriaceae bacterium]